MIKPERKLWVTWFSETLFSEWGKRGQGRSEVQTSLLVTVRGSRLYSWGSAPDAVRRVAGQWRAPGGRVLGVLEHVTSPRNEVLCLSLASHVPHSPAPGAQTSFPPVFTAVCSSHAGRLAVPQTFQAPLYFWTFAFAPSSSVNSLPLEDGLASSPTLCRLLFKSQLIFKILSLSYMKVKVSHSVVSGSLWPHGL